MRIGLVTACYKPVTNGVTRMVELYASAYRALGHEPTVFTLGPADDVPPDPAVIRSPGISLGSSGYFAALNYTPAARKRLQSMDIVHAHHLAMSLEFARANSTAPLIYTNHTRYDLYAEVYTPLRPHWLARRLGQVLAGYFWPRRANLADIIIAPTHEIAQTMRRFGVDRPLEVIPNGIELQPFYKPVKPFEKSDFDWRPEHVVAVYCGRLAEEKNLKFLLHQFANAARQNLDLRLLLIGHGPQRRELEKLINSLGLNERVNFTGEVHPSEVPNYLAAGDFFVTASKSEVHPLTVIEAMASGLPLVALDTSWLSGTASPEVAVITSTTQNAFAQGLLAMSRDNQRRRAMGQMAREHSRQFDFSQTALKTLELYQTMLAQRKRVVPGGEGKLAKLP